MELVPIIWSTLLLGTITLFVVLIVSYILSKLKKDDKSTFNGIDLIPDRPVVITRRHSNPKIQVTSSRMEKRYIAEKQPKILDISGQTKVTSNKLSQNSNPNSFSGSRYGGSGLRNPRFTILNETMNNLNSTQQHIKTGNSFRFSETNFS